MRRALGAILVLLLWGTAAPASAIDATPSEIRELAERAIDDPSALEELREVDSVDGRPVDVDTAVGNVEDPQLERRLRSLADDAGIASTDEGSVEPTLARRRAEEILEGGKYTERDVPRPFKGVLDAIGRGLRRIGDWVYELLDDVTGGNARWALWGLLVVAALLGAWFARHLIRRRVRRERERRAHTVETELDPRELERAADEAERAGRLEEAIRLRFRAGLIRLSRAHLIPAQPSLTSGDIARHLRLRSFEEVAATFDEVVYGRRAPSPEDAARARTGWTTVLDESRSRAPSGERR